MLLGIEINFLSLKIREKSKRKFLKFNLTLNECQCQKIRENVKNQSLKVNQQIKIHFVKINPKWDSNPRPMIECHMLYPLNYRGLIKRMTECQLKLFFVLMV